MTVQDTTTMLGHSRLLGKVVVLNNEYSCYQSFTRIPATDINVCVHVTWPHATHKLLCVYSDLYICNTPYAGVLWWALSVQTITIQSGPETVSKLASQSQWRLWHFISRIVCTFSQTLSLHVHAVWYRSSILHRKSVCNGEFTSASVKSLVLLNTHTHMHLILYAWFKSILHSMHK